MYDHGGYAGNQRKSQQHRRQRRRRRGRRLAGNGILFQGPVRFPEHHRRTAVGFVPSVVRAVVVDHAESEPAEGLPGEPAHGRRSVLRAGAQEHLVVCRRRGAGPAGGRRHAHMADGHPEQRTVRFGHIHRVVERQKPKTETMHARPDSGRTRQECRAVAVRVLLLPAPDGGGWSGGVDTDVHDRRTCRFVLGRVLLYGRHKFRKRNETSDSFFDILLHLCVRVNSHVHFQPLLPPA